MIFPDMRQYDEAAQRHPGMVILFRAGVSWWAFGPDADTVKKAGGIRCGYCATLPAAPANANFGHKDLEGILRDLLRAGNRVALLARVVADARDLATRDPQAGPLVAAAERELRLAAKALAEVA